MGSLNPAYSAPGTIAGIRSHFDAADFPSVSLQKFLAPAALKRVVAACAGTKEDIAPLSHSYRSRKAPASLVSALMADDVSGLIRAVAGRRVRPRDVRVLTLRHGSYEMRRPSKGLQFVFCVDDWDASVGGEVVFADRDGNTYELPSTGNTLSIVRSNVDRFIRYVNHRAGKRSVTYVVGRLA